MYNIPKKTDLGFSIGFHPITAACMEKKVFSKWAKEWKADAIIGQWNNDTVNLLKELNIPIVLQNYHHRSTTYSNLTGDYKGTGRMAAQFFAKRMFHNFAYFGINGVVWSDERCEGFRQEVKRIGGNFYCFESDKHEDENQNRSKPMAARAS